MNKVLIITVLSVFMSLQAGAKRLKWVENALDNACFQSRIMIDELKIKGNGHFPRSIGENGELVTSEAAWWCSGFFPGVLWQLYELTGDSYMHDSAKLLTRMLSSQQWNKSTHDLGFMIFCSYGHAMRLEPCEEYRNVIINASESLSSRFNENVGCIQSWDSWNWWQFPVIIDNMMNLEMLLWASQNCETPKYRDIAVRHADKTMANHFRNDMSSYHVVSYCKDSGEPEFRGTNQGVGDASAWARGQAWGLYGYTVMYRFTKDKKYLAHAQKIADFIIDNPGMSDDMIPYWDFSCTDFKDTSAAAVIASALLELSNYSNRVAARKYSNIAERQLKALASESYTAPKGTNHGFILLHGVGNYPAKSEIDKPLSYGDYYYIEALARLKKLYE